MDKKNTVIIVEFIKYAVPLLALPVIIFGIIYVTVHQTLRQGANDPQIQMAEDIADNLQNNNNAILQTITTDKVDLSKSLAPFVIVFDSALSPLASNAVLNGQTPTPPTGVFESAKQYGENRITWEPSQGVRSAIVVTSFSGRNSGFVVAGRSLREIEKREDNLFLEVVAGWLVSEFFGMILLGVIAWDKVRGKVKS